MLIPGIPVAGLVGLLYATSMAQAPFEAARSAILPDILKGERYALAAAVMQTSFRIAIVAGAVAGGITVAFIGVRPALGIDVATFVVSAALVRFGTKARPAASAPDAPPTRAPKAPNAPKAPKAVKQLGEGARLVLGDKAIRTLMMLGWLIALYSIPEGIAAPYAATLRGGPRPPGSSSPPGRSAPSWPRRSSPRPSAR